MKPRVLSCLAVVCLAGGLAAAQARPAAKLPDLAKLQSMAGRFAPTEMRVDTSALSPGDRQALAKLVEAARIIDDIFLTQMWSGNHALYARLEQDASPLGRARLHYFWLNKGPWSEIDNYSAFLPGVPATKPAGANFYPPDMSKQEFEGWLKGMNDSEKAEATGFFTVIRREKATRKLVVFAYSVEYRPQLERCARLLREAADLTGNQSLKTFLLQRADAFLTNDYYESDLAWMDLDAPLDITIGPYETYNDQLYGYKAAFEAYINLRDEQESAKLAFLSEHLQEIEDNLPEDAKYRNPKLGALAPLRVVDVVFSAGDGNHGIQTAAYNLPNDDRVIEKKGSKRVMLKNVQEAKFRSVLLPIAGRALSPQAQSEVSFDAFFTHIVAHELTHGLGPHQIKVHGRDTNPRLEIKELYGAIEEAKADVTGLVALQYLLDHRAELGPPGAALLGGGVAAERRLYTTYLASSFRSLRFGLQDAHARGMAMQFNYLMDKRAFVPQPDGTFAVDFSRIKEAVRDLDHDLLTVEAKGDYEGAKKMLATAVIRPEVKRTLDKLQGIPTDIDPVFVTANEVAPAGPAGKKPAKGAK